MSTKFARQVDLVKQSELEFPIIVIGAGGIGSWATLALAKMGCTNLSVIDFDKVEDINTPSQFYKESQIGELKVQALQDNIQDFANLSIIAHQGKWEQALVNIWPPDPSALIIISALDSLSGRKKLFKFFEKKGFPKLYIDARMGGELIRIFNVSPFAVGSIEKYKTKLFSKTSVHKERCTEKAIVYNTFMCGSIVASFVKKFAKHQTLPFEKVIDIVNLSVI